MSGDTVQGSKGSEARIAVLLLPSFNAMATTALIDPFRASNYLSGERRYSWHFVTRDGGPVAASNGMQFTDTVSIAEAGDRFDFVFVSTSWTPEEYRASRLFDWLRRCAGNGAALGGIDTGAFLLAFADLLDGYTSTVHYEHLAVFRELFPDLASSDDLFVIDRDRLTCCGGAAASDMALEIIRLHTGMDAANAAARYIFHDRLRPGTEGQFPAHHEPVGYAAPTKLRDAIVLMERNLEDPLPLSIISEQTGLSNRQLQRLFASHTGVTPVRYYLEIRLDRARSMVTQTDMSMMEIAVACGFTSQEYFARVYKERFSLTPSEDRQEGRVPFQFRSFPSPHRASSPENKRQTS